jgi:hypothetical protein
MKFRQALFWDVDPRKIDTEKNARYIIERVLGLGQPSEAGWVFKNYTKPIIKSVRSAQGSAEPQIKSLWSLVIK